MYYKIWVASQRFHGNESLTYEASESLSPGQIVSVPLQNQTVIGIVDAPSTQPAFKTKPILFSWPHIVPSQLMLLLDWLVQYYPSPMGSLVELFTPPALIKKQQEISITNITINAEKLPKLTREQLEIFKNIADEKPGSFLLHGDTGTGKTRIYLELALKAYGEGRSSLILTPEIGLTQQLRGTFEDVFGKRVLVTHSDMSPVQRRKIWLQICNTTEPVIVIGPRSAMFAPLANVGLIVMDEAHDTAYKQAQTPHYQTSRVAAKLARHHSARFIMGTATPLIVDFFTFRQKSLPILRMNTSALPVIIKTTTEIIDHRDKALFTRSPWLSTPLLESIDYALERKEQALLFLNRRGSARLVMCGQCGWQAMCPHCDVALTYHQDNHSMRCHSCNFADKTPSSCPDCRANDLIFKSIGTKALETEMKRLYAGARIARFDRDTPSHASLSSQYDDLHSGSIDILIGTQAIAKGFDLPKLTVAGIIQADSGLQIPDYTSNERTYQLISQVSGRVGRGHLPGKLFLQSFNPDSPLIAQALSRNYEDFYAAELAERKLYRFPPYYFLLKISCVRATSSSAKQACEKIADIIYQHQPKIIIEGPTPRFIEKLSGKYGWHLVIKAPRRSELLSIIKKLPGNCTYDIDPSDLL